MALAASGEQHEISHGGYRAVVVEVGGGLRVLEHDGRPLVGEYDEQSAPSAGRGQLLIPWPNRIRDGRYPVPGGDTVQQLPVSEVKRHNASHGLTRWTSWRVLAREADVVRLGYRLMAQSGYPWTLDLAVSYRLSDAGLEVGVEVENAAGSPAPFALGAHPYLVAGEGPGADTVDGWQLALPAATRVTTDERKLPTGTEPVAGTAYDFRSRHAIGDVVLDDAFTDLERGEDGRVAVELRGPDRGVRLWADEQHGWLQVYSGDDLPSGSRRSLAVEPMTAPADAFNSGAGLILLEPGEQRTFRWGIQAC